MYKLLKKLKLIDRNIAWWQGNQSVISKLLYYPSILISYIRFLLIRKKHVLYLGHCFSYDTLVAPLSLMYYPQEISRKVLDNTDGKPIRTVLDIGGNIGQFASTMVSLNSNLKTVDIFEPNSKVINNLKQNLSWTDKKNIYNYGVGKPGKHTLFASKTGSGTGSLIKENAGNYNVLESAVTLTDDIPSFTKRNKYDLIVIDVEGYEYDVVLNLHGLSCRYLFIELTGYGKKLSYSHSNIFEEIKKKFGMFQIVHSSEHIRNATTFYVLLEFEK
jgi:FkbM family methyltransferase